MLVYTSTRILVEKQLDSNGDNALAAAIARGSWLVSHIGCPTVGDTFESPWFWSGWKDQKNNEVDLIAFVQVHGAKF